VTCTWLYVCVPRMRVGGWPRMAKCSWFGTTLQKPPTISRTSSLISCTLMHGMITPACCLICWRFGPNWRKAGYSLVMISRWGFATGAQFALVCWAFLDCLRTGVVQDFAKSVQGNNDWVVQPDGSRHPESRAVKGAVLDFATLVNRQVSITYEEPSYRTWLMRK
jgi:hypothetical protein